MIDQINRRARGGFGPVVATVLVKASFIFFEVFAEAIVAIRLFLIHGPATPVIVTACRRLGVALNFFAGVGLI